MKKLKHHARSRLLYEPHALAPHHGGLSTLMLDGLFHPCVLPSSLLVLARGFYHPDDTSACTTG